MSKAQLKAAIKQAKSAGAGNAAAAAAPDSDPDDDVHLCPSDDDCPICDLPPEEGTVQEVLKVHWAPDVKASITKKGIRCFRPLSNGILRAISVSALQLLLNIGVKPAIGKQASTPKTIMANFAAQATTHYLSKCSGCGALPAPPAPTPLKDTKDYRLPVEWLLVFIQFTARYAEEIDGKNEGSWVWRRCTRSPQREITMEPFFRRLGLDWTAEYQKRSACLFALNILDEPQYAPSDVPVPPLQIDLLDPPNEQAIVEKLSATVKHQERALRTIAGMLEPRLWRLKQTKPGVVLMPGPPATGKTTTAEAIVRFLFGDPVWEDPKRRGTVFLQVDLNDFAGPESLARLIGAEAGLVTSDKGAGVLIEWLQHIEDCQLPDRPVSGVLLLDELDKAGKETKVLQRLMGLMEYGTVFGANVFRQFVANKLIILCATNAAEALLNPRPIDVHSLPDGLFDRVRSEVVDRCCGGQTAGFSRFDAFAFYFGFGDLEQRAIIRSMLEKRLPMAAANHGAGRIMFTYDESLVDRMVDIWNEECINARSARNFCARFEQLATAAVRALEMRHTAALPGSTAAGVTSPASAQQQQEQQQPIPLLLRCTSDSLECIRSANTAGNGQPKLICSQRLQKRDTAGLAPLHRVAATVGSHGSACSASDLAVLRDACIQARDAGAIDVRDKAHHTPLHYAASNGCCEAVACLLQHGANVAAVDDSGYNALMHAVCGYSLSTHTGKQASAPRLSIDTVRRIIACLLPQGLRSEPPLLGPAAAAAASPSSPSVEQDDHDHAEAGTLLDRLMNQTEAADHGHGLERTAALLAFDGADHDDEAAAAAAAAATDWQPEELMWRSSIVACLMGYRAKTNMHLSCVQRRIEVDPAGAYDCDIDSRGHGLMHRLFQRLHRMPLQNDEQKAAPTSHDDPFGSFFLPTADLSQPMQVYDYSFLVPPLWDAESEPDLLPPHCAQCTHFVLQTLSKRLCVHNHPSSQHALIDALERAAPKNAPVPPPDQLQRDPVLLVFREWGIPIDWHHAGLCVKGLPALLVGSLDWFASWPACSIPPTRQPCALFCAADSAYRTEVRSASLVPLEAFSCTLFEDAMTADQEFRDHRTRVNPESEEHSGHLIELLQQLYSFFVKWPIMATSQADVGALNQQLFTPDSAVAPWIPLHAALMASHRRNMQLKTEWNWRVILRAMHDPQVSEQSQAVQGSSGAAAASTGPAPMLVEGEDDDDDDDSNAEEQLVASPGPMWYQLQANIEHVRQLLRDILKLALAAMTRSTDRAYWESRTPPELLPPASSSAAAAAAAATSAAVTSTPPQAQSSSGAAASSARAGASARDPTRRTRDGIPSGALLAEISALGMEFLGKDRSIFKDAVERSAQSKGLGGSAKESTFKLALSGSTFTTQKVKNRHLVSLRQSPAFPADIAAAAAAAAPASSIPHSAPENVSDERGPKRMKL